MKKITLKNNQFITLRKLDATDEPAMQLFFQKIGQETINTNNYPNQPPKNSEKIIKSWQDEACLYLGAFDNNIPVGLIIINIPKPDHPWLKHLGSFGIMILQNYQGLGLGSILMQEMLNFAIYHKLHRIEGEVRVINQKALALYKKFGFEIEGRKIHAAFINGEWFDNYLIAKLL